MFLNLFLFCQVVRPLGLESVNKYLRVLVCVFDTRVVKILC